ncbi:MAG: hypothetical protein H6R07_2956 [Proteobacteria bacterium]|nr:hypothetical protein [Pseudomonadota bacterium]
MTRHFLQFGALAIYAFCFSNARAENALAYKLAEYTFEVASSKQKTQVRWSYPVFLSGIPDGTSALNVWIRDQSLEPLAACAEIPLSELRKMRDVQVQRALGRSKQFADCNIDQSEVQPMEAFASFISFQRYIEWAGLSRPQHGITMLTFDWVRKRKIGVDTLFRPGALDDLNEALAEQISSDRTDCQRNFDWSQVSLRPPSTLFINFPYNPGEWAVCGDGVEMIEGPLVKAMLI